MSTAGLLFRPSSPLRPLFQWRRAPQLAQLMLAFGLLCNAGLVQATQKTTELRLESWRKDDQMFWEQKLLPAFHQLHPEVRVTFAAENPLEYDSRLDAKLRFDSLLDTKLTSRKAGDLIFCRPFDGSVRLHERKQLAPLPEDVLAVYSAQARKPWTSDDGKTTYCVPVAQVIHGVFYNRGLLREMGEKQPVTVDEFFSLLERTRNRTRHVPLALGLADMWEGTQVLFTGAGPNFWSGEKGRQNLLQGRARFTDKGFMDAWRFMARLRPYLPPAPHLVSNSEAQILFAKGSALLFPSGSWDLPYLRHTEYSHKSTPIDLGVFRFPVEHPDQRCQVSVHPDFGIGMNAESLNQEAAMKFLRWLGTPEFAQLLTDHLSGFYPLSKHQVQVNDPVGQEMLSWRQECDETIRLNTERLNRVWPSMEDELWYVNVKVLDNSMSPTEAAAHIQKLHERNSFVPHPR